MHCYLRTLALPLCVGLVATLAHAQSATPAPAQSAPAPSAPSASPVPSTSPAQGTAAPAPGTTPSQQGATSAPAGSGGISSGQSPPATTNPAVTGTTGMTPLNPVPPGPGTTQTGSNPDTGAANVPADNAQLNGSINAQNTARQSGLGAPRDNAFAEWQRQRDQFASAPAAAAPGNARNGPGFGAPAPGTGPALNPANQGPVPGSDYATASGVTSTVYEVRVVPPTGATSGGSAAPSGTVVQPSRAATGRTGGATGGTNTPAAGARGNQASPQTTRIYTYGPGGGDNVVGLMRLAELQGQFRFSRSDHARAERKKARAEITRR
jgi:hypothetical protein